MNPPDCRDRLELDEASVTIRTMRPAGRDMEQQFTRNPSPLTRYHRFHTALRELRPCMLDRFTRVDYPDEMALIAAIPDADGEREIGVSRFARSPGADHAEIAVVVAHEWQGHGIGLRLLLDLRNLAREAGIRHPEASVLPQNRGMPGLARAPGFSISQVRPGNDLAVEPGTDLD
jgi:acetyltransferase